MELLELTNSYIKKANDYKNAISNTSSPAQIFDMLEDLQKDSVVLDGAISKIEFNISQVKPEILGLLTQMRQNHTRLMTSVHERNSMELSANTSGFAYDENHTYKDIVVGAVRMQTMDEVMFRDITIDEIIDPREYSTLAIINKLSMFNTPIDVVMGVVDREFSQMGDILTKLKVRFLDLRTIVNSGDCMDILTASIWTDEAKGIKSRILDAFDGVFLLSSMRKDLILLFQILVAMEGDMEIFEKVVNQYTAITTESFFNPDSVYRIL